MLILLDAISKIAKKSGTIEKEVLNDLINKGLKNTWKNKGKIKARLINDELPKVTTPEHKTIDELIEFIKTDDVVDVEKLKDKIHYNL
ncbi:MAG: hypothetical protein LBT10_07935 [Methanobrevibacter sp.]|jgi:hypothetical protein|nr:hypothetical protein [Methanobrevibacter sp.]